MIKGCIQLGYAPDMDMLLQIAPIDYVCQAIVHLSLQEESLGKTFHLVNPKPITWSHLFDQISLFGFPLKQIPYLEWRKMLVEQLKNASGNALYPLSPLFSEYIIENTWLPRFDCKNTLDGLEGTNIKCPPLDSSILNTYFSYLISGGFFESPVAIY